MKEIDINFCEFYSFPFSMFSAYPRWPTLKENICVHLILKSNLMTGIDITRAQHILINRLEKNNVKRNKN